LVTKVGKHALNQIINRGVGPRVIIQILRNPEALSAGVSKYGYQLKFYGDSAVVVINELGKIITVMLR
jgi:hypothetical protein